MKEQFQLIQREDVARESVVRPGNLLMTVRDYTAMHHFRWALERTDTKEQDVVVMEAHLLGLGTGEYDPASTQIFSDYEQTLFTRAVAVAESYGKRVLPVGRPGTRCVVGDRETAVSLKSAAVVAGLCKDTGRRTGVPIGACLGGGA